MCLSFNELEQAPPVYDRFVSAFTLAERVQTLQRLVVAKEKHLLVFSEYRFLEKELTAGCVVLSSGNEGKVIDEYLRMHPIEQGSKVAVDITGFLRPHLLFLLKRLSEFGLGDIDFYYAEPRRYRHDNKTIFSLGTINGVRQVEGYAGSHTAALSDEVLIVGCGYDTRLMRAIAQDKLKARKVRLYSLPALQPHMYQESRMQSHACQEDFEPFEEVLFAPAYDPFAVAMALEKFVSSFAGKISDLFLCPLATKPQVLGFGLYYLDSAKHFPALSLMFPVVAEYSKETATGLAEVWRYRLRA